MCGDVYGYILHAFVIVTQSVKRFNVKASDATENLCWLLHYPYTQTC